MKNYDVAKLECSAMVLRQSAAIMVRPARVEPAYYEVDQVQAVRNQFPEHCLAGNAAIPGRMLEPAKGDPGIRVSAPSAAILKTLSVPLSLFT
jgi:hypothetical protein